MPGKVIFGLIGYPLGHSFSKVYFTEKFERENLSGYRFDLFPLENIRAFPALLREFPELKGLAVTIPYKEQVMTYLTGIDPEAEEVGAVNCIRIDGGYLKGYNTDIIGFENSLRPLLKSRHTHALVLGSGGASKAVSYVLKKLGIHFKVVSRYQTNDEGYTTYSDITPEMIQSHKLIVNCTPLGMTPHEETFPDIPYGFLSKDHLLYDLVYKPKETMFMMKGREQGAVVCNGYDMFLIQAEENWRIWSRDNLPAQ